MDLQRLQYHQRFDELCKQLLYCNYPNLRSINGRGGDEGTDSYVGTINSQKCIFQFKFFPHYLRSSHWKKIKESFSKSRTKRPKRWTLLISSYFTREDWQKWEQLEKSAPSIKLQVWDGPKLANMISKHQKILTTEFPELFPAELVAQQLEKKNQNYKLLSENIFERLIRYELEGLYDYPEDRMRLHYDLTPVISSPYYNEAKEHLKKDLPSTIIQPGKLEKIGR